MSSLLEEEEQKQKIAYEQSPQLKSYNLSKLLYNNFVH